jgi:hypothetical protein
MSGWSEADSRKETTMTDGDAAIDKRGARMRALMACLAAGFLAAGAAGIGTGPMHVADAAGVPECGTHVLRATIGGHDAGVGNIYTTLVLRNVGHLACLVQVYPGVSLVDRHGRQIGRAARRVATPTQPIILRPGGTTSTVIHTLNPGVGTTSCLAPSAALRVYPPDQRASLLVPARLS